MRRSPIHPTTKSALFNLAIASVLASVSIGCLEPLQNGGTKIVGDPSERLATLCKYRHGDRNGDAFCAAPPSFAAEAHVHRMTSAAEGLKGPYAEGQAGDFLLENDEIAIVIRQPGSAADGARSGCEIIDAGSSRDRTDELGSVRTSLGAALGLPECDTIVSGVSGDGAAWVETSGRAPKGSSLATGEVRVRTRVSLTPGARAATISTTVLCSDAAAVGVLDLGDVIQWGKARPGAPGIALDLERSESVETRAPYIYGAGGRVAYAIAAGNGTLLSRHDSSRTIATVTRSEMTAPLDPVTVDRLFVVAPRGDTASVATEMHFLAGGTPGSVDVRLAWGEVDARSAANSRIVLRRIEDGSPKGPLPDPAPLWISVPGRIPEAPASESAFAAELPPGRYVAKLAGPSVSSAETIALVRPGRSARISLVATGFDGAAQIPQKEVRVGTLPRAWTGSEKSSSSR